MIPSQIPPDTASNAEVKLYEGLQESLDDQYTVIHSVPWLSEHERRLQEGECDFLVLHPSQGMLSIETKSGDVRYDGRERQWYREDRPIKDPFLQAQKSQHVLNRLLSDRVPGWRKAGPPFGHAVSFPHADRIPGARPAHIRDEVLLLRADHQRLDSRVPEILNCFRPPIEALPRDVFKQAIDQLLPQFQLTTNLSADLDAEYSQLCRMTDQQIQFMQRFSERQRLLVEGCAGSGKTMLAMECAARLLRDGARVLILCFNIPLAEWLRELAGARGIKIDIYNFHDLCERIVTHADLPFAAPFEGSQGNQAQEFWDNDAPDLMDRALETYPDRYDAILVDEGQDFCTHWWLPIQKLLRDPDGGHFSIFYDPRQDLWNRHEDGRIEFPIDQEPIPLSQNCRNTRKIASLVHSLGKVEATTWDQLPEGVDPVRITVADEQQELEFLRQTLHNLVQQERVDPRRIVIVGTRRFENTPLAEHRNLATVEIVPKEHGAEPGEVRYVTVFRFKGLEADCVILIGFADPEAEVVDASQRERLYVAASRARLRLFLVFREGGS